MALQPPPAPARKKGLGCLGCGCAVLLALLFLILGLFGTAGYFLYREGLVVTSTAPLDVPAYAGGEALYDATEKKIDSFNQDVGTGKASTLTLTADEINGLLAHDPDLSKLQAHTVVTFNGDEVHLEGTMPTDAMPVVRSVLKDRYLNIDATFTLTFNSDTKLVGVDLHKVRLGDTDWPTNQLTTLQAEIEPGINSSLKKNQQLSNALQAAKTVTIRDGQFVIETK